MPEVFKCYGRFKRNIEPNTCPQGMMSCAEMKPLRYLRQVSWGLTPSHELPLRYCRSSRKESSNEKKPTFFGKLSTCLLKPSYLGLYMLRALTLARLAGFEGLR